MPLLDKKKKVFGNIAALRTLTEGFPQLKLSSSFPSINNNGDAILFLTDLIKSLMGYEALVNATTDTLVYALGDIEREVKIALKAELKSIVSCGVNPSLPDFLKSTGAGITFTTKKIDFTNLLYVNPYSTEGKLLYNDPTTNLIDSSDFNTFLYQTVQNNGSIQAWGTQTTNSNILNVRFDSTDITNINPNNTFKVTANSAYNNKKLTDFNNDYVDSINLFNTEKMVASIVDASFGSITTLLKKTVKQLEGEAKLGMVIDRIVNSTADVIEDKVFNFASKELQLAERQAELRQKGIMIIQGANQIQSKIPASALSKLNAELGTANTLEHKKELLTSSFNTMANFSAERSGSQIDVPTIKLNFIQEMINKLTRSIINSILSPKVLMIFVINYKIIYGPDATFDNGIDFIKKNKTFFQNIMKRVAGIVIKRLLAIALKRIAELVAASTLKIEIEKAKNTQAQLLSLVGVSQDALRMLKGLL